MQVGRALKLAAIAVAFLAAVAPRGWFHHCDQDHVDHHHPVGAAIYADLDCEVCAVAVATYEGRPAIPLLPTCTTLTFRFATAAVTEVERPVEAPASRGPPAA